MWTRVKRGSVILLQRFLPGGNIVVNTSKASSGTVLKRALMETGRITSEAAPCLKKMLT